MGPSTRLGLGLGFAHPNLYPNPNPNQADDLFNPSTLARGADGALYARCEAFGSLKVRPLPKI